MRKLKTALSLTLALVLSLALTVPAFAAPVTIGGNGNFAITTFSDVVSQEAVKGKLFALGEDSNAIPLITVKVGTILTVNNGGMFPEYDGRQFFEAFMKDDGSYDFDYPGKSFSTGVADGIAYTLTEENIGLWYFTGGDGGKDYYLNVIAGDGSAPEQPTQPTTPTEPEQPTQPTTPVEPEQPTQPTTPVVPADGAYKVSTSAGNGLNVRTGPGTNYKKAAPALREGTVIEIVEIQGQWGKLANDAGWVFMPGTKAVSEPAAPVEPEKPAEPAVELPVTLQVSTSAGKGLNVRTGPGTNYKLASAALREGTVIEVVEIDGQWGKLADDAGWVFLPGTKAVKG